MDAAHTAHGSAPAADPVAPSSREMAPLEPVDPAPALLPPGSRLLHIGPPKSGTTTVQAAFHAARSGLGTQGVHYAGSARHSTAAAWAAIGRSAHHRESVPSRARWTSLLAEIRATSAGRVLFSSEFLAHAEVEAIRRLQADLDPARVQVVVTLRPVASTLHSHWQQKLTSGYRKPFEEWLHRILAAEPDGYAERFWHVHRHDALVERWAAIVGEDRVTVVVVDPQDHAFLLRSFERLTGLRSGTLPLLREQQNRSLTAQEAALVRAFNDGYVASGLDRQAYERTISLGAMRHLRRRVPGADEGRIVTPRWALEQAATVDAAIVERLGALGVRVVGDLALLGPQASRAGDGSSGEQPGGLVSTELGAAFGLAVLEASGVTRVTGRGVRAILTGQVVEPGETAALSTMALGAVVLNRTIRVALGPVRELRTRRSRVPGRAARDPG